MSRDMIRLPHDAYRLLQTLRAAGHSAYVVGGCVRDSLLGRLPGDWDICTSARPDEMKALFCSQRLILTGEKHGTVAVILHGKPYEMTTYRLDGSYRDHRHPDNVQFVDDLAADLARRDFTINAMAYAPGEGVIDLYGGRSDLAARVVRCVVHGDQPHRAVHKVGGGLQAAQDDPRQLRTALVVAFEMRSSVRPDAAAERLGNVMQKRGPAQHPHAAGVLPAQVQCAHGGGRMLPDVVAMPFSGLGAADAGQDLRHSAA